MSIEDHLGTPNIFYNSKNLSEYLCGGLTRHVSFPFSFVSSVSNICMLLKLYFQDFCAVFL